jgi:hypothetical protein
LVQIKWVGPLMQVLCHLPLGSAVECNRLIQKIFRVLARSGCRRLAWLGC